MREYRLGTDFQIVQVIFNRVDIDLSGFVIHNGVVVDKAVGIAKVVKDILYVDILENRLCFHNCRIKSECRERHQFQY